MDLCWVVVGQKMEDVMDAEPPFRLLACHYLYGHVLRSFIYFQVEILPVLIKSYINVKLSRDFKCNFTTNFYWNEGSMYIYIDNITIMK